MGEELLAGHHGLGNGKVFGRQLRGIGAPLSCSTTISCFLLTTLPTWPPEAPSCQGSTYYPSGNVRYQPLQKVKTGIHLEGVRDRDIPRRATRWL